MPRLLRAALLGLLALALLPSAAFAAHDVTIGADPTSGFDVNDNGATRTYTANADSATLNADTLAGDLASHAVVVNTGSGGAQNGTVTVTAAVTTDPAATNALTLNAPWNLTVNASMNVAGPLQLNSPLATTINFPVTAASLLTDDNGEYFVNAGVTAAGDVSFMGQANLAATVTSQSSDVNFSAAVWLAGDSTVDAAGNVSVPTLDGSYNLTVVTGGELMLGYVGAAVFPVNIDVTGNTELLGTNVTATGAVAFHGDVNRVGSEQFDVDQFTLGGTFTGGDVTINDATLATFADGSAAGTDAAPLDSLSVIGPASLGNTSVVTTNSQAWQGAVSVPGTATVKSAASLSFSSTIDGAGSLTIDPGASTASLLGAIGSTTPLSGLTVLGAQTTDFQAGTIKATSVSLFGIDVSNGPASVNLESPALTIGAGGINKGFNKTLTITGGGSIAGPIGGNSGSLTKAGTGTLVLSGTSTWDGQTTVTGGGLVVNGVLPGDLVMNGSMLSGTGSLGGSVQVTNGGVSPGASPGILAIANDLTLDSQSTFTVELNGTTAGSGYDQVTLDGQVDLGGAALQVSASDSLPVGQPLTIISKTSGLDVNGTFAGKPEGATFDVGSVRLAISYTGGGGDNNDVTLTRVRQPSSLTLTSGPADAVEGSAVTLTATVNGPAGTSAPAGTVTFKDGETVLGTAPVSGGVATLTTAALTAGDHSLSANFSGDFNDPSSATASQHIAAKPVTETPGSGTDNPAPAPPTATPAPPATAPTISVRDAKARKGFVTFLVSLSRASTQTVTVSFRTKNGTARAGRHYKALKGKLTFKPGVKTLLVKVKLLPRKGKAAKRRFSLVLSGPQGATLARGVAIGTILK